MPSPLQAAGLTFTALVLLPPLLLLRFVLRKLLVAYYQMNHTPLRLLPTVSLPFTLSSYLTGHSFWGTAAYLAKTDSVTVASSLNALREELGPVFVLRNLLATPTIQIADTAALRHVCFSNPAGYPKTAPARRAMGMLLGADGILFAEGRQHARIKKVVSPALHFEAVGIFGAALLAEAAALGDRFLRGCGDAGGVLPLKKEVGAATFRAILRAFVGRGRVEEGRLQALEDAYLECIEQMTLRLPMDILVMACLDFLPAAWICSNRRKKVLIRREVAAVLEEAMERQRADGGTAAKHEPGDAQDPAVLLSLMANAAAEGTLSAPEMTDTMLSFLAAGQATSALSVAWTLYLLARHPTWLTRLQAEVDASGWTAGGPRGAAAVDASVKALDGLPLLGRCVKEGLRLHPPAAYSIRATAAEDVICGARVPAGVMVNIPILALHMSQRHWGSDPASFDPDRFLPEAERQRDSLAWCPFLMGPRGCIGRPFALLEIKAFVAEVVRVCDVSVDRNADEPLMYGGLSGYPPGLKLYGRPRRPRRGTLPSTEGAQ
jgi:cytochrome P450